MPPRIIRIRRIARKWRYTAAKRDTAFGVTSFMGPGTLTVTLVPEPSARGIGLVMSGVLGGFARRRRTGVLVD